jgi:hypothetical protein
VSSSFAKRPPAPVLAVLLGTLALACTSCGSEVRKPVFPARGKVLCDQKPAPKAIVTFHPLGTMGVETGPETVNPHGVVAEDGTFQLTTYSPNDGAPAGKYAVTIIWRTEPRSRDEEERTLLPLRYGHPGSSGLRAEVKEGPNEGLLFNISRR